MSRVMRALSRKDFFRLGGTGLAGVVLVGAAGCGGSLGGRKKVVKFLTSTEETSIIVPRGGEVAVSSKPGRGTSLEVRVPLE